MMMINAEQLGASGSGSKKRPREDEENGEDPRGGDASKKAHLVEPCPKALAVRALAALDTIGEKLRDADPELKITTAVCDSQAVCWNWALYGGAEAMADDPRVYLYEESQKKKKKGSEPPAVRERDKDTKKIQAVLAWRGMREDDESRLTLVVYAIGRNKGDFPHWEYRWADANDPEQYITITKGINEDLKAFNGDSVVAGASPTTFKVSLDSLSEAHVLALEDLAKNPVG